MTKRWLRWEWWVGSLALLVVAIGVGKTGALYILQPVPAGAAYGMLLATPDAISHVRIAFGALHTGLALVALGGLIVPSWRRSALICAFTFGVVIVVVRTTSVWIDGVHGPATTTFKIEVGAFLALALGLIADVRLVRKNFGLNSDVAHPIAASS